MNLVVPNVSWVIPKLVRIVLKRSAFPPELSVPFRIVYADNPKYASKTSTDSPNTFLNRIVISSQEGMQKSIYFYREASLSPPHPSGRQALCSVVQGHDCVDARLYAASFKVMIVWQSPKISRKGTCPALISTSPSSD